MKYFIFAVKDEKNGFGQPVLDSSEDSAIRNFAVGMQGNQTMMMFPNHFSLWKLGEYVTDTGEIMLCDRQLVVDASAAKGMVQYGNET